MFQEWFEQKITRRTFLELSMMTSGSLVFPHTAKAVNDMDLTGGINQEREFVLPQRPTTADLRDAVNVWIEERSGAFALRIGVEALAEKWDNQLVWLDIAFPDGRVLNLRDESGPTHPALDAQGRPTIRGSGGVSFQCLEPFKHWRVTFSGQAPETTAMDLIQGVWPEQPPMTQVTLAIDMHMAVPPWAPGSMLKKSDTTLNGEQAEFISPRYEQLFRCQGSMQVGDQTYPVNGNGLRIRRQGVRKFEGFWGHCWQSAVFPSGKAFGFNTFPPRQDGEPSYNEGYVFNGSGVLKPARVIQVPWITELKTQGDDVSFVLATDEGEISVEGKTFINTRSRAPGQLPPGFPIVQQAHAIYRWNGEETVGMVERSSLPEVFTHLP
ncbi:hypothetical protein [Halioxenophilus sp. WMMB6]|uniref:hypothetical protein n=1 Tax=Halioxenophilus sp. WMMB6 TaxID=3073815 RepID=UPI00295E5A4F|nr:hypothetical protein [Halioxenophilus sp. WMMB6]